MENIITLFILFILLGFVNLLLFYYDLINYKKNIHENVYYNLKPDINIPHENVYNNLKSDINIPRENIFYNLKADINIPHENVYNNLKPDINVQNIYYDLKPNTQKIENINTPPERVYIPRNFNIPTRGYPDEYQLIGYLINNNGNNGYNIYGRQKYPGADLYEYFVYAVINNNNIKIPLNINKELNDGQHIDFLKDNYKVKLYPYELKYIP